MKRFIRLLSYFFSWLCRRGDTLPQRLLMKGHISCFTFGAVSFTQLWTERWIVIDEPIQIATAFLMGFVFSCELRGWTLNHSRGIFSTFLLHVFHSLATFIDRMLTVLYIYWYRRMLLPQSIPKKYPTDKPVLSKAVWAGTMVMLLFLPLVSNGEVKDLTLMFDLWTAVLNFLKAVIYLS